MIETGLRSVDARRLPFDPITTDEAGAPYLRFVNHKLSREAIIPIWQRLLAQIRRQQARPRERFGFDPPLLLPRPRANPDANSRSTLSAAARGSLDGRLRHPRRQRPAGPRHPHQFRHTLGTRMINNEVPLDTVQRMLDHDSPEMTPATPDQRPDAAPRMGALPPAHQHRGELIPLDPGGPPVSDAAWALENLARAKQTLPNGYCGLPLQQTCPHPNACLTCDSFLTTVEFLPQHREQLTRTEQLIADARVTAASGWSR